VPSARGSGTLAAFTADAGEDRRTIDLVDEEGRSIGAATKIGAHSRPGRLHRAVSVLLLDSSGRLLLQRRAGTKYHFAGLWTNTCCGHPAPGEEPAAAATRRLLEELGLRAVAADLILAGVVRYRASDPASGLVEDEYDHVLVGRSHGSPIVDSGEVGAIESVSFDQLRTRQASDPFTPWFGSVLKVAMPSLVALASRAS
jgi:isopentenyl-diphosphate Delta-isomerase